MTFTAAGSQTVSVVTLLDSFQEPNETFYVDLTNPTNATLQQTRGTGTIRDPLRLSINDVQVREPDTGYIEAQFTVSLSSPVPTGTTVSVNYATQDDTATQPGDYQANSGTLQFLAGETSKTVLIRVNADALAETDEQYFVNLSNPAGAEVVSGR